MEIPSETRFNAVAVYNLMKEVLPGDVLQESIIGL